MSLTLSFYIISIIVLVLVILIGSIIYNSRQRKKINTLEDELELFEGNSLAGQVSRLTEMTLSGESLSSFNNWQKVYQDIQENKIPELRKNIEQAEDSNSSYHLLKTKKFITTAEEIAEEINNDLNDSAAVFDQLLKSDQDNAHQMNILLKDYQAERKNILSNSFKYGGAIDYLENQLTDIEADFDLAKGLSDTGDHVEAKRVLSRVNMAITSLSEVLPKLEKAQREVWGEFPEQLDEITEVYKQMTQEKYNFPDIDILSSVRKIRNEVNQSDQYIQKVEIDKLESNNLKIADKIENLYHVMEVELKSRKKAEAKRSSLLQFFEHALNQSENLIKKLDHIDQSYQLTHGELKEATALDDEIKQMQSDFAIDQQKITEGEAIYSLVLQDILHVEERLVSIEARQKEISDDVDGLFEAEKIAQGSLDSFAQEVSLIKRKIDRQRLPGLPRSFVDFYNVVLNEISDLNSELNQVRINLEQISNKLILVQKDINRLRDEGDEIIAAAHLVERTIQYANKYITTAEIKLAVQDAIKYYQSDYDYKKALDTIATALEKQEPGAFHRIEQDFANENQ